MLYIIILVVLLLISLYIIRNLYSKLEFYEQSIEDFYSTLSVTLHMMRAIDDRQMFENDDEVGEIFNQLKEILSTLRPILYGKETDDEKN